MLTGLELDAAYAAITIGGAGWSARDAFLGVATLRLRVALLKELDLLRARSAIAFCCKVESGPRGDVRIGPVSPACGLASS